MTPLSLSASFSTPLSTTFAGAQALWWPCASRRAPKVFLLFIPGNPGLASYYIPFLSTIYSHSSLRNNVEILALSHRGHAPLPKGSHPVWGDNEESMRDATKGYGTTLNDQIRHKIAAVDAIRQRYPVRSARAGGGEVNGAGTDDGNDGRDDVQLVIAGHSVGAYICAEVLKARPDAVDGLHLLFPTLSWIANTPNGRRLRPLFHPLFYTLLLPLPLFILSLIPLIFFVPLVRLLTSHPKTAVSSTVDLLRTPGAVRNAIRMAADEMKTIKNLRADVKLAVTTFAEQRQEEGRKGKTVRTYWSRGDEDGWAPSWLRTQVEKELNLQHIHLPAGVGTRAPLPNHNRGTNDDYVDGVQVGGSTNLVSSPLAGSPVTSPPTTPGRQTSVQRQRRRSSRARTQSFSLSDYRSASASMPKLQNATARRKPTGEIVIETTVFDSSSDGDNDDDDEGRDEVKTRGDAASSSFNPVTRRIGRASSTVCRLGMPHAFCLEYGEEMGEIASHWLVRDHL